MTRTWTRSFLSISLLLTAPSCVSSEAAEDDEGTSRTLVRTERCEQTACQASHERCLAKRKECTDVCLTGSIDDAALCLDICRNIDCDGCSSNETSPCVKEGYTFRVTGVEDKSVRRECERFEQHLVACGVADSEMGCEILAQVARHELSATLECAAESSCGGSAGCLSTLPASDLGEVVCDVIADRCPLEACAAETPALLNDVGAWLRTDAALQAIDCAQESCSSVWPCLEAWSNAIGGG
jgi:hypothetical protein